MPKSKASAFFSVLLVFLSGAALGAVGYRLYAVKTNATAQQQPSPEDFRRMVINSLRDKVKLDEQQLAEVQKIYQDQFDSFQKLDKEYHDRVDPIIDPIYKDFRAQNHQIHQDAVAKIKGLLRPDQVALYDKWQAERAAQRADTKRKQPSPPPDYDRPGRGRPHPPGPRP
jgi:hypothetical protein